jgi:hypothetical protein
MATAFEAFIQLELPKRPYLETDVTLEDVIIRRGVGPRQLDGVTLSDGQVLGKVGGVLTGVSASGVTSIVHDQSAASATWTITHNKENRNAIVKLRDASDQELFADTVTFNDNDIVITLTSAEAGKAMIVFLD